MADIKTKDNAKGTIRTIDKAAVATQRMLDDFSLVATCSRKDVRRFKKL